MVTETAERPTWRRLAGHALVLWVGMLALMPVIGVHRAPLISDEGALLMQLETFERHDSWWAPYPLRDLDPNGDWVALGDALHEDGRLITYTSRPVYVGANALAHRIGGVWGVTVLAVTTAALTAMVCGLIAREVLSAAAVPALWLAGVGTPVLFHGYVLQGHTIGTLGGAVALLCAMRAQHAWRHAWPSYVGLALALLVGSAVRRELAAVALGFAVWGLVVWWRHRRAEPLAIGGIAVLASVVGLAVDRLLLAWVTGPLALPNVPVVTSETEPLIMGRIQAAYDATLLTTFGDPTLVDLALLFGLGIVVVGAVRLRRDDDAVLLPLGLGLGAVAAVVKALVPGDLPQLVPGLLVAAPVLVGGLILLPRQAVRDPKGQMLTATATVALLGVTATQYSLGWGWGARFLLVGIPSLSVLGAIGWVRATSEMPTGRSALRGAAIASVAALALLAVTAQRDGRLSSEAMTDEILDAAGPDTVVVTTELWLARYDTDQLDEDGQRWAWAPERELDELLDHLAARGVERIAAPAWEGRELDRIAERAGWVAGESSALPRLRVPLRLWSLSRTPIER